MVPRRSRIGTIHDLKGKRACLGPYNDIYQWNIPVGILLASETMVPDCRGELHTVENFFFEACAAGNWSSDPQLDDELSEWVEPSWRDLIRATIPQSAPTDACAPSARTNRLGCVARTTCSPGPMDR